MWICPKCNQVVADTHDECPSCKTLKPYELKKEKKYGFDASSNKFFEISAILLGLASLIYGICYFCNAQPAGGAIYLVLFFVCCAAFILKLFKKDFIYIGFLLAVAVFELAIGINNIVFNPRAFDCVTSFVLGLVCFLSAGIATFLLYKGNHKYDKILFSISLGSIIGIQIVNLINLFVTYANTLWDTYYTWFLVLVVISQLLFIAFAIMYFLHIWTGFGEYTDIRKKQK